MFPFLFYSAQFRTTTSRRDVCSSCFPPPPPITAGDGSSCFTNYATGISIRKEGGREGHTINETSYIVELETIWFPEFSFWSWCKKPQNSIFGCCKDAPCKASACLAMKVPLTERTETRRLVFVLDQCHISRCPVCIMPSLFRIIKYTKNNAPNTPF